MASGVNINAGGRVIGPGGAKIGDPTNGDCCCTTPCCPDGNPATMTLTLAGVSLENVCLQCDGAAGYDSGRAIVSTGSINGTFTLASNAGPSPASQQAGACAYWKGTIAHPTINFYWFGPAQDCTDPVIIQTTSAEIWLARNPGGVVNTFDLRVVAIGPPSSVTFYDSTTHTVEALWTLFLKGWGQTNCKTGFASEANGIPPYDCNGPFFLTGNPDYQFAGYLGSGGTATLSTP